MPGALAGYADHFRRPEAVAAYLETYAPGSGTGDELVWTAERERLAVVVAGLVHQRAGLRALDYACGGGRILRELAASCREVHGWDSSPAMLLACAAAVPQAQLRLVDLASGEAPTHEYFDLITAFRLLLNLEPEHRLVILRRLAALLHPDGVLVVNNHGNRNSLRHLSIRFGRRGRSRFCNELSHRQVTELLEAAGLRPVSESGYGWVPELFYRQGWSSSWARRLDSLLIRHLRTRRLAIRVLYVARRSGSGT